MTQKKYDYYRLINNIIENLKYKKAKFKDTGRIIKELNISHNPKIIVITGTNGKGSTALGISHFLLHNKVNHVIHTSPHLEEFNERICHNGAPISKKDLYIILKKIRTVCSVLELCLNYYMIGFLASCLYMQKKKPFWFILEVGIGGKLDPANYFNADIAILTCVGMDHKNILGKNISKIALDKINIARPNKPIIIGEKLPKKAYTFLKKIGPIVIHAKKNLIKSKMHFTSLSCTLEAIKIIKDDIDGEIPESLYELNPAGRCQKICNSPDVFIDVAHNESAVKYLIKRVDKERKEGGKTIALFATKKTKDIKKIYRTTNNFFNAWLIPNLFNIDNTFHNTKTYKEIFIKNNVKYYPSINNAYEELKSTLSKKDILVVFGSFIVVKLFLKKNKLESIN